MTNAKVSVAPKKNKGMVSPKSLQVPTAAKTNVFTALVAKQNETNQKAAVETAKVVAKTTTADAGVAVQVAAKIGFVRKEQNGRKDYTPHTTGNLIWQTADTLQALTPLTPITSAAMKLALPHVNPNSISCGLSHWRKFHGTMRVKGQQPVAPVVSEIKNS